MALGVGILLALSAYGQAEEMPSAVRQEGRALSMVATGRGGRDAGAKVSIIAPWSGADLEAFWAVAQPFAARNGLRLSLESTPDVPSILAARIAAGAPPDLAILPAVGSVRQYAADGALVPLRCVLDVEHLTSGYPAGGQEAVSCDGELYGALFRLANESLVWYSPAEFQRRRWTAPLTWQDLVQLADDIARRGLTPWSLGLGCSAGNGEPGTDWIENILLRIAGPDTYDRWVRHEIPWTDPALRQAFLQWGEIVGRPRNLRGGPEAALEADALEAVDALYQEVPAAYLYLEGSAAQARIARRFPRQVVGRDYDCFVLPPMSLEEEAPVVVGAEAIVLLNPSPQAGALLRYLLSEEAQATWLQEGGFVAPNAQLDLEQYPDPVSRKAARQLAEAETVRLDASEQMPAPVAAAFRQAVREFVANPGRLDSILAEVERVAVDAYGRSQPDASCEASRAAAEADSSVANVATGRAACWEGRAEGCLCEGLERSLAKDLDVPAGEVAVGARYGAPGWGCLRR